MMHATHGTSASVSASSTSSGGSGPAAAAARPNRHRNRLSARSDSISSASVTTVKRPGSVSSSGTAVRHPGMPTRAQSPGETSLVALPLGPQRSSQDQGQRNSVATVEPVESGDCSSSSQVGHANLNRLSQSTNSSEAYKQHQSSSKAALRLNTAFSPTRRNRAAIDHSPRASPHRSPKIGPRPGSRRQVESPPGESPARDPRQLSKHLITPLSPLHTIPGLTDPNDAESPSTIQTIATPLTQPHNDQDYFGGGDSISPRDTGKSKKPMLIRNHTAPMATNKSARLQPTEGAHGTTHRHKSVESRDSAIRVVQAREQAAEGSKPVAGRERDGRRMSRSRTKSEKDKKSMLSKALQKANTAVLLDNAQNFEGALDAYNDACRLLQQVMDRSSGVEDQRKLAAIKVTYKNRIEELRQLEADRPSTADEKSLPTRPMSDDSQATTGSPIDDTFRRSEDLGMGGTATHANELPTFSYPIKDRDSLFSRTIAAVERSSPIDDRRITFFRAAASPEERGQHECQASTANSASSPLEQPESPFVHEEPAAAPPLQTKNAHLPAPNQDLVPTPLLPRRPSPSPARSLTDVEHAAQAGFSEAQDPPQPKERQRADDTESTSWLNTINESGSSSDESVHSVGSQHGLRRKHLRGASHTSMPDFDAAFDAAVEAAYNEGLEPDVQGRRRLRDSIYKAHAAKESIVLPSSAIKEILSSTTPFHPGKPFGAGTEEDEEEERLLDDITQDYANTFNFDLSSKSALPRQSDSSGYSRSTWQSSQVSDRTTAGTSLTTVAEDTLPARFMQNACAASSSLNSVLLENLPPSAPPPLGALPRPPSMSQKRLSGVRERRLSGQNAKVLKIETASRPESRKRASASHQSSGPDQEEEPQMPALELTESDSRHEQLMKSPPSLDVLASASDQTRPATATTVTRTDPRISEEEEVGELRSHRPAILRKNKSSISLREHMMLSPTEERPSAFTPMSLTFGMGSARRNDSPLTSQRTNFPSFGGATFDGLQCGGPFLFDTSLSNAAFSSSPRSPDSSDVPAGLEPCPESFLLRPFWLMRSIASTLIHPKGGFVTTRLFVPREVWSTRGVKLKAVEDKIANCDLLTAALGRLAGVDTYDADAVADELQSFEEVLERVQTVLTKKLGSDVGSGGLAGMFKDATHTNSSTSSAAANCSHHTPSDPLNTTTTTTTGADKTKSKEGKAGGYLSSLRKLRSKSSGTPLGAATHHATAHNKHPAGEREVPTMASVPMTIFVPVERRGRLKRGESRNLAFEGPNREYMGSLARLFDGVQVLDLIARQVEDPGLKGSSPAHVGLELSVRHAAEFFAFFVCRFVLADLGILVDKFVKRGSEWVLG